MKALLLSILLSLESSNAFAAQWEPEDWPPPAPGVYTGPPLAQHPSGLVEALYRWYHARVSSRDGARCPFYPTCSGYALLSYREHHPLTATMLVLDRLLREYPWMDRFSHYPVVTPHGVPRFFDPVPRAHRKGASDAR